MLERILAFFTGRKPSRHSDQVERVIPSIPAGRSDTVVERVPENHHSRHGSLVAVSVPEYMKIKDGRHIVKYLGERVQGGAICTDFEITCGSQKGAVVSMILESRLAKRAIQERSGGWVSWMAFEGDKKCGDLEHALSEAHDGQFAVTVKDGAVRSILDPYNTCEDVERRIFKEVDRPMGGFQREGWADMVELAIQNKIPLDLEYGPKPECYEAMVPQGWEEGHLILKKAGGRKVVKVRRDGISCLNVSELSEGSWSFPPTMETFVLALVRHPSEDIQLQALYNLEFLGVDPESPDAWGYLVEMAEGGSPKVKGCVADKCRSWTIRERKTVLGKTYAMLVSSPAVLDLLKCLANDPDAEVRMKACYALGDHPDTPAGSILESLAGRDASKEVRNAALHALGRLREFENVRREYLAACTEKALKNTKKKTSVL